MAKYKNINHYLQENGIVLFEDNLLSEAVVTGAATAALANRKYAKLANVPIAQVYDLHGMSIAMKTVSVKIQMASTSTNQKAAGGAQGNQNTALIKIISNGLREYTKLLSLSKDPRDRLRVKKRIDKEKNTLLKLKQKR